MERSYAAALSTQLLTPGLKLKGSRSSSHSKHRKKKALLKAHMHKTKKNLKTELIITSVWFCRYRFLFMKINRRWFLSLLISLLCIKSLLWMEHLNQSAKLLQATLSQAFTCLFLYHSHHKDSEINTPHWRLFDISKQVPAADWVFPFSPLSFHNAVSGGKEKPNTNCTKCTGLLQWWLENWNVLFPVLREENMLN